MSFFLLMYSNLQDKYSTKIGINLYGKMLITYPFISLKNPLRISGFIIFVCFLYIENNYR